MSVTAAALTKVTATTLAGVFAGGAVYITVVQHPATVETNDINVQAPFFRPMYSRAAPFQGTLTTISGITAISVYFLEKDAYPESAKTWLWAGSAMLAIIPYTVTQMFGVNHQLIDTAECKKRGNAWFQQMLVRWSNLHNVRTVVSVAAFSTMVFALTQERDSSSKKLWA